MNKEFLSSFLVGQLSKLSMKHGVSKKVDVVVSMQFTGDRMHVHGEAGRFVVVADDPVYVLENPHD